MNHSIMQRTLLSSAIVLSISSTETLATVPDELLITNMQFDGNIFNAGGQFNVAGTVGPFDPLVDLDLVPGGRELATGFDPATASGNIYSFDKFFGHAWEGVQKTIYLTNTDVWNDTIDSSLQGPFNYDADLAAMTDDQIAVGMFFTWNGSAEIAVLEVFDCDAAEICKGNGVEMANGPFSGSVALFDAGLSCKNGFALTDVDALVAIDIAVDVLGNDPDSIVNDPDNASKCSNPTAVTALNPEGLVVESVEATSANGGVVTLNGTVIDFTPAAGFEGPDRFVYTATDDTGDKTAGVVEVQVGGELQSNFSMLSSSGNVFGGTNDVDFVWDGVSTNNSADDGSGNGVPTDTNVGVMTIGSPQPFFNFNWNAHHVRVFQGPGTFMFDVTCTAADYDNGDTVCNRPLAEQLATQQFIEMTLAADELGGHILFNWGKVDGTTACGQANCDIDVVNVWKRNARWDNHGDTAPKNQMWIGAAGVTPATDENSTDPAEFDLVSTDFNGDGINASPMVDGAFIGSYANFNSTPNRAGKTPDPVTGEISDVETASFSFSLWSLMAGLLSLVGLRRVTRR